MKNRLPNMEKYCKRFGQRDLDRIGLFIEMPYIKQVKPEKGEKEPYYRRMLAGCPKTKCGTMDSYFGDEFQRLFIGEGLEGKRRQKRGKSIKIPFIPTGPQKKHACPGDYFGTFQDVVIEFSPKLRPKPKRRRILPNFVTSPAKKGGPGYIDITIAEYPEFKSQRARIIRKKKIKGKLPPPMKTNTHPKSYFHPNPYRDPLKDPPSRRIYQPLKEKPLYSSVRDRPNFIPIGPGQWIGGCKGGTFSPYPAWKEEPYLTALEKHIILCEKANIPLEVSKGPFIPPNLAFKRMYNTSVLVNTNYSTNATNWRVYEPTYVKRLLQNMY